MLYILWNVCAFIITVGILVSIHELGHFIVARIFGVTIQRFSIGFGYILWKYRDKKNTEYVISAIPLGGYVKMLNKNDLATIKDNTQKTYITTFEEQAIWRKTLIIAAGPIFNIIFAFIIYWLIFTIGISTYRPIINNIIPNSILSQYNIPCNTEIKSINNVQTPNWESVRWKLINIINNQEKNITIDITDIHSLQNKKYSIDLKNWNYKIHSQDIITSIGIIPMPTYTTKLILSKIKKHSPAMQAGLKIGDKIISINNQQINTWEQFKQYIKNHPNNILNIAIQRKNEILLFKIKPDTIIKNDTINGHIGVFPTYLPISKEYITTYKFNPIIAIKKSIEKVYNLTCFTCNMLYKLIFGNISLQNLGGPISIAKGAREATQHGIVTYLIFLSFISINLGIINLLPLPILDGGYLFLLIIEKTIGEKKSKIIEKYTYQIGIILLILLTCLALFNDLSKLYFSK